MAFKFVLLAMACVFLQEANGHGKMMDPVSRSSVWRVFKGYPANYNDMEVHCGGARIDWTKPGASSKCGVCGDPVNSPSPQPNQNGGKYGKGKVVRTYKSGQVIDVKVELSANHGGTFQYSVCALPSANALDSESCFQDLTFENGSKVYQVPAGRDLRNRVRLPAGLKCARCVLRWHYIARSTGETYRSCADISIE